MKKMTLVALTSCLVITVHSQAWNITGNNNINPAIHFLGTTNNQPLKFRVSNVYAGEIDSVLRKAYFGYGAGINSSGSENAAFGFKAMNAPNQAIQNTAFGCQALSNFQRGYGNTAVGQMALFNNISGSVNTAIGRQSLWSNTQGYSNTAVGDLTLYSNTTGGLNIAIGISAMYNNTSGNSNVGVGVDALSYNTTGFLNTAIGNNTLWYNVTGGYNTAVGNNALTFNNGFSNTAVGVEALLNNTYGNYNTALGYNALYKTTGAWYNTAIGYRAGANYDMGYNNTLLGASCDIRSTGLYNCIAIGQGVVCTASSQARIGNSATSSIGGYANWTNISDVRYKKDIAENVPGLNFIMKLKPITYHLDISGLSNKLNENTGTDKNEKSSQAITEKEKIVWTGFSGQQVDEAAKEIGYDFSGVDKPKNENDLYGLRYSEFVVPLVKAVQEQQKMIEILIKENSELQKKVAELEKRPGNLITKN